MSKQLTDIVSKLDENTFLLDSSNIDYFENINTGLLYNQFDELLKLCVNSEVYIITHNSIINYLEKFHKIEFTPEYICGVKFLKIDYTSNKKVYFITQ